MTIEQGMAVADWVSTTGKNLTTVYVTHGHGDHWFGLGAVRERFPGVRAVATPAVIEGMRKWSSPELAELRQAILVRLMEQRQLSDPFGFLVYAELAGAELSPVR
jgi:glyoxylase-like metal-dependent hydrolase (beta-lactamase superfamily II)